MRHTGIVRVHAVTGQRPQLTDGSFVWFLGYVLNRLKRSFRFVQIIGIDHRCRIVTDITVGRTLYVFGAVSSGNIKLRWSRRFAVLLLLGAILGFDVQTFGCSRSGGWHREKVSGRCVRNARWPLRNWRISGKRSEPQHARFAFGVRVGSGGSCGDAVVVRLR